MRKAHAYSVNIFTSLPGCVSLQQMDLYEAMFTALVQDRMDFVQLFIDNGVDLKRFLTVRKLRDLYDDVSIPGSQTKTIMMLVKKH